MQTSSTQRSKTLDSPGLSVSFVSNQRDDDEAYDVIHNAMFRLPSTQTLILALLDLPNPMVTMRTFSLSF